MSDDLDHLLSIDDEYFEDADFSSDLLAAPTAPRPPSAPRPLQSAFDPTYARRSAAPVHQDTAAPDTAAASSEASTASIILFMMRQQQEQQEQQARREEQQLRREREYREEHRQEVLAERERRDQERADQARQQSDLFQLMTAALTAQTAAASAPRPIAVFSTKSDAKLAETKSIVDIRGMFDTAERFNSVFDVQLENEVPVTNTIHALSQFRATIKAHCRINTPDMTDSQLKSAMFLHFEMGKSGISITDFRPKDIRRVDSISELGNVMGLASRIYSDFFGPHIRCGFERLKSDLDLLVHRLPGSITTSAAIELVDTAIAATRDFFRHDQDATPLHASHLGVAMADAMSITVDHPMVCDFVSSSIQAVVAASVKVANSKANPADSPVADRNKRQPKTANTLNTGAAGGASSAREVAGGASSPRSASPRPTIPGKSPCYSWASRTGPCGSLSASDDCCQVNGPYPHKFDPATTPKEKAAFLGWLKKKE